MEIEWNLPPIVKLGGVINVESGYYMSRNRKRALREIVHKTRKCPKCNGRLTNLNNNNHHCYNCNAAYTETLGMLTENKVK